MSALQAVERFWDRLDALDDPAVLVSVASRELLVDICATVDARPANAVPLRGLTFEHAAKVNHVGPDGPQRARDRPAKRERARQVVIDRQVHGAVVRVGRGSAPTFLLFLYRSDGGKKHGKQK